MLPSKFSFGAQSSIRKSRLEVRPSMLPKPVRPGSIDRQSTEARRPSNIGGRSSSAEPPRNMHGGSRLGRETSATKVPLNKISRPQQAEKYNTPLQSNRFSRTVTPLSRSQQGDKYHTPLRTASQYSRTTATPRTPSEDRASRNWQTSVERALSFVTKKDERPVSHVAWQRAEFARVSNGLAQWWSRDAAEADAAVLTLVRPLTIARFVEIAGALLYAILNTRITTDNYVAKLPHVSKRLLYPGTVSKAWLKTVNTPHAFPHALALISYLLDLATLLEQPVSFEWLYASKDELFLLRRSYLYKCWERFQKDPKYEEINEEHLDNLTKLLGIDDEKIAELENDIKVIEESLNDKVEQAARQDEERRVERLAAMRVELKELQAEAGRHESDAEAERQRRRQLRLQREQIDQEIDAASGECQRLRTEVEKQGMTVAQRARLLDEMDYALRVHDSKRALADQIAKMIQSKEMELALWQKKTLDCCLEYKQGLILLSAQFPELAALAVDEKDLMEPEWAERVSCANDTLRRLSVRLAERRAELTCARTSLAKKRIALLEETNAKIAEVESAVKSEQEALDALNAKELAAASAWDAEQLDINKKLNELRSKLEEYMKVEKDLEFWERQDVLWRDKLSQLEEYIQSQQEKAARLLESAKNKRTKIFLDKINEWKDKITST